MKGIASLLCLVFVLICFVGYNHRFDAIALDRHCQSCQAMLLSMAMAAMTQILTMTPYHHPVHAPWAQELSFFHCFAVFPIRCLQDGQWYRYVPQQHEHHRISFWVFERVRLC